ncbi:MAG: hypothetical protein HY927_05510 [Elusimicrobia bacterium]|nr:hypothetical protein [Elusimicrobiota bacterium]
MTALPFRAARKWFLPAPAAFFLFLVLPYVTGCTEGCGESPESNSNAPASSGGSGATSRAGGGEIDITPGSGDREGAVQRIGGPGEKGKPLGPKASGDPSAYYVETVDAASYKQKVLGKGQALVSLFYPGCSECDLAAPVMKALSIDYKGKMDVYRMDASANENLAVLPRGFTLKAYPGFVLYRDGSAVSWRGGLPFEQGRSGASSPDEPAGEYQGRLGQWFHGALARQNLGVGQ